MKLEQVLSIAIWGVIVYLIATVTLILHIAVVKEVITYNVFLIYSVATICYLVILSDKEREFANGN